jgi:hypothetical protein
MPLARWCGARTGQHHGAKSNSNRSVCAVMYLGPMRTVRGDERWEANCSPSLASHLSSPLAL